MNSFLGRLRERWRDQILTMLTAVLGLILFVTLPLQALELVVFQAFGFLLALVLIIGIFVLSSSHMASGAMLVALAMATTATIFRFTAASTLDVYLAAGAWLIMAITLGFIVSRAVFASGRVTYHRIAGAILLYLTIAVIFAALYTFMGLLVPKAFSGISFEDSPALASNVIYFSFVTLTSTGYGDVFPVHPMARSLCNLETILGQLYPATLLARLVSLEIEGRR
jgi:hypothetical protein